MKKIFVSLFCAMIIACLTMVGFTGCGEKQYTYVEFVQGYNDYIDSYRASATSTISMYDANGRVSIVYPNSGLNAAINKTTTEAQVSKFTRLTNDINSKQAVFEPAFNASVLFINKYINTPDVVVPVEKSNQMYQKLITLSDKTRVFYINLVKFETRAGDFDESSIIDQAFLSRTLDSYYEMILASCALSLDFIDMADKYFAKPMLDSATGRVAPGVIERFYLAELTKMVDTYVKFSLSAFYNQAYEVEGHEFYTDANPAGELNTAIKQYLTNASKLATFENRYTQGAMSAEEKAVVDAYRDVLAYETYFGSAYAVALDSLSKMPSKAHDLDETYDPSSVAQAHRQVVESFVEYEFVNKLNLMADILEKVSLA